MWFIQEFIKIVIKIIFWWCLNRYYLMISSRCYYKSSNFLRSSFNENFLRFSQLRGIIPFKVDNLITSAFTSTSILLFLFIYNCLCVLYLNESIHERVICHWMLSAEARWAYCLSIFQGQPWGQFHKRYHIKNLYFYNVNLFTMK